jgi:hypothetical protein
MGQRVKSFELRAHAKREIVERAYPRDAQSVGQNYQADKNMHGFKILSSTLGCKMRTHFPGLRPTRRQDAGFPVRKVTAARRQRRGW